MMHIDDEPNRMPSLIAALARDAIDRATLRRAFGVSLLRAWRTLGKLLARADGVGVELVVVDQALVALDDLRIVLRAMRESAADSSRDDL